MFFYIVHELPWGKHLTNGQRNTRTFFIGGALYIMLHAYLFKSDYADRVKAYREYIYYVLLLDIFTVAIKYKMFYGRSIVKELREYDTDKWDEKKQKYIPHKLEEEESSDDITNLMITEEELRLMNAQNDLNDNACGKADLLADDNRFKYEGNKFYVDFNERIPDASFL